MHNTILVVEDEKKLADILADYLRQAGYRVDCLYRGDTVLQTIEEHPPAAILLDIMLPGVDGISLCRDIRQRSKVPILMLTARVEEVDRLLGLELGADDYICKPYSPREVVARVKAILRRCAGATTGDTGNYRLDEGRLLVSLHGRQIELTAVEFHLLQKLVAEPGRIFSRDQLMNNMYPDNRIVSDRTIDSHVKKLRKKLAGLAPTAAPIRSVYGVGYRFQASE